MKKVSKLVGAEGDVGNVSSDGGTGGGIEWAVSFKQPDTQQERNRDGQKKGK